MTKLDFVKCCSCKYMDNCPKSIIPDSLACEIFRLDQATKKVNEEFKKALLPKWLRRWLGI